QAIFGAGKVEEPAILSAIADFNFLYFSSVLFVICVMTIVVVSLVTAPPPRERLEGTTYASLTPQDRAEIRASWNAWDLALTATVIVLVLGMYIYFSFWLG